MEKFSCEVTSLEKHLNCFKYIFIDFLVKTRKYQFKKPLRQESIDEGLGDVRGFHKRNLKVLISLYPDRKPVEGESCQNLCSE